MYQLARNDKARHVFFSYPNNCEITFDGNAVPEYYFKLPAKTNTALRHDFTLKKSGQIPPSKFVLYLIADSQVKLPYMESRFVDDIVADINADVAGRNYPCIAVTLGDDGDDNLYHVSKGTTTTTFKTVSNLYGHLKIPCFHCIGNHDHDKTIASGDDYYYRSLSSYEEAFSPVNYSFNFGNVHFVVMDDVRYTAPSTYTSGLLDEQVEWLRQDLSYVPTDRQVYVCLHIPIRGAASFQNRDALFDLLKPYPLKRILRAIPTTTTTTSIPSMTIYMSGLSQPPTVCSGEGLLQKMVHTMDMACVLSGKTEWRTNTTSRQSLTSPCRGGCLTRRNSLLGRTVVTMTMSVGRTR